MDKARKAFEKYVEAAELLAESVKRNIVHERVIDDETVVKLNNFIIAANEISALLTALENDDKQVKSKSNRTNH